MKAQFFPFILLVICLNGCVSASKFNELKEKFSTAQQEAASLRRDIEDCRRNQSSANESNTQLKSKLAQQSAELEELTQKNGQLQKKFERLQKSYDALEKNSSQALASNSRQNRELLEELEEKQANLQAEEERLENMQSDLKQRSRRIDELEQLIAAKDAKMKNLKNQIVQALTDFEGQGLTVEQRDGKVYVSMENKLLFSSGSYTVNSQGQKAVRQLAGILEQNPDINVLIEGHTDNVPYNGSGNLNDNWDLSTKRATSIVHLLIKNSSIAPKRLTAAGRSEFAPVASNDSEEGRAKNRRIEVILTPKLDQLDSILNDM